MISHRPYALLLVVLLALSLAVVSASQAAVLTVTNTADDGSPGCLRWCIEQAQPGDEIRFDPSLDGQPIVVTGGELVVAKDLTIAGRGVGKTILDGNYESQLFRINYPATVTISGMSIRKSKWDGIYNSGGNLTLSHLSLAGNSRAGVRSRRTLTIRTCSIDGNFSGGVRVEGSGTLTLDKSYVGWNRSYSGAGLLIGSGATATVTDSTIYRNLAQPGIAGGILVQGKLLIENSTLALNGRPGRRGNGIWVERQGEVTVVNTVLGGGQFGGEVCYRAPGAALFSSGHNLDRDGSCGLDHPTDQPNRNPRLGCDGYPGPTGVLVPCEGSPVIDRGWCDPGTDQRGVPRPLDGDRDNVWICDIGAVEYNPYRRTVLLPGGEVIEIEPDGE